MPHVLFGNGTQNKMVQGSVPNLSILWNAALHIFEIAPLFYPDLIQASCALGKTWSKATDFLWVFAKWGRRAWQLRTLCLVTLQSAARMQVESRRRIRRSWKSQKCISHLILLWMSKSLNSTKKTQPRKLEKKLPTDVCLITCTAGQLDTGGSLSVSWFWFQVQNARNRRF